MFVDHPITTAIPAIHYVALLRTYLHLDRLYYLDVPFVQGRVRLTNLATGEYVIYGNYGPNKTIHDVGKDESLFIHVPRGMLRVRDADGQFHPFPVTSPDIETLGNQRVWAMRPEYGYNGELVYNFERVTQSDILAMRETQYQILMRH